MKRPINQKGPSEKLIEKRWLQKLGPGFITGASDDDPSGIATYAQTGARFGYTQLWTALFTFPFMAIVQEMCGRIGLVTGKGLAGVIRTRYPKCILYGAVSLLFIANTINIGADLGAMAASARLIIHLPFLILLLVMTFVTLALEVFVSYKTYASFLKYLTFALFAYVITVFVVHQDWDAVAVGTLLPHFSLDKDYVMNIVAILGTTISPYLFFWQANEEVEESVITKRLRSMGIGRPKITPQDIDSMRIDTISGMLFSNLIMFFIMVTAASTLFPHGITSITSAEDAALALKPIAGDFASMLFVIGIVGTGLLAVPVLAGSASYAIAETFRLKEGLSLKCNQAWGFYGIIALSTITGLLLNFTGIPPFLALYYTAIINGIAAPPLLLLILLISNDPKVMGVYVNGKTSNILGSFIAIVMAVAAVTLLESLLV